MIEHQNPVSTYQPGMAIQPVPAQPAVAVPTTGAKFDPETGQPIPKFDPETGKQNW